MLKVGQPVARRLSPWLYVASLDGYLHALVLPPAV
jgi:hypothetical protein